MFRALGNTRYGGCRKFWLYHVKIHEFSFHLSYWDLPASTVMGVKFAFEKKLYRFFKQFWVKIGIYGHIFIKKPDFLLSHIIAQFHTWELSFRNSKSIHFWTI